MIYLFLGIPRQSYNPQHRQQFRIEADNFNQANRTVRQQHARDFVLLNIGRINPQQAGRKPPKSANFPADLTACNAPRSAQGGRYA